MPIHQPSAVRDLMSAEENTASSLTVDRAFHSVAGAAVGPGLALPRLHARIHAPGFVDATGAVIRDRLVPGVIGAAAGAAIGRVIGVGTRPAAVAGLVSAIAYTPTGDVRGAHLRPTDIDGAVAGETLRVMEYNVHGGMGGPKAFVATPKTLDHLAEVIGSARPDIVLLQELDHFALRSTFTDTLAQLARRLRPTGAVMTPITEKIYGRREGTGVMTFGDIAITDARGLRIGDAFGDHTGRRFRSIADTWAGVVGPRWNTTWTPFGGTPEYQPRGATDVMVRTPKGNHIRVISGHFSSPRSGVDEQTHQLVPVVATIPTWAGPTILGADFNVRDGSAEFDREHQLFADITLAEATRGAPANSDRVYASGHFRARDPHKITPPHGEAPASDHAPVIVDLELGTA
ncbi:endonuclease/exonuclease/phosphatase family protein [Williamsia sp. CHRR-6]|uniref:endonuclease/exonuclease/phosphatase family protein n=1 Tax=Williamsia sp. CHRR-6 TaxID=2835871 RepID=UPI001BDAC7C8|nr:endonuclease/exonuclease/phosphatase family protein [Williamsia sp. CHRR-6]MBT0568654.1 endonuclease/exonuclease/phosphatase family protein [Williamsia sp. CHRR-6]